MTSREFCTVAHAFVESLNEGFEAFDSEWRYTYLNRRAEQSRGRKREDLLGKVYWEEYPQAVGTEFHARCLEAMASGQSAVLESFYPFEDRWAEISLHPLPDGLALLTREITERKRSEEAVRRSQRDLEDFFENGTLGLHWVDANGIIVRANRAELEMLGYAPEEYIGHSIAEFHVDAPVIEDILCRLSEGQVLRDYPARLRCKNGSVRHVVISSSGLFEDGKFIRTRCFTRDVTDTYVAAAERERADREARAAAEIRATAEALRASEERFRLLVEQVKDYAIFLLDPAGHIATWNEGAQRFKGYRAEEIIGQHFSRFYTPEDIARRHPWAELEIAKREGQYEEEGWRVRKDGSRFFASVVITALRDEKGTLRGFAKVTRDVTERREREREQAAAARAEQQRRILREVLSSVTDGRFILCESATDLPERLPGRSGTSSNPLPLTGLALRGLRKQTAEAAREAGLDKEQSNRLLTAVSEAAMNAVTHARDGTALVVSDLYGGRVQVWIEDKGEGIDMGNLPRATLEPGYSTTETLGHGFKMMLQSIDRLWLLTGPGGTTIVLEQGREAPLPNWLTAASLVRQ